MILALDCETSNLVPHGAIKGSAEYPWPVSIAACLFTMDGRDHAVFHTRIRSDGRTINPGAESVHGISSRAAGRTGIPEIVALSVICHMAGQAQYLTGYNVEFDRDVLESAVIRLEQDPKRLVRPGLQIVDLMQPSTALCKLSQEGTEHGYRWPKLQEAMSGIRHERGFKGHDALADCRAAKRLFLSLVNRKVLDIPEAA